MTDLPLTKLSETPSTVTLGWEPVPCLGYVLYRDGVRTSNSWDPTKKSWPMKNDGRAARVVALAATAEGTYPPITPPPVVSGIPNDVGPWATRNRWNDTDWRPDSAAIVAQLAAKANQMIVTVRKYGMAIVTATASDPLTSYVKGGARYGPGPLTYSFRCPVAANSDEGSDGHLAVIQPDGQVVEMYNARRLANGTYSCTGSGITTVNDFTYIPKSACLGSSFTISAGAILPSEVKAGLIPHALAAMFPSSCVKPGHVWPSNDDDGENAAGMTQEGMRFVLDPSASLSGMTGLTLAVAKALQDYGMIVTDKTTGTDIDLRGLSSASFTTVSQPNQWAAIGITTDYPSVAQILPLIPKMKVVKT